MTGAPPRGRWVERSSARLSNGRRDGRAAATHRVRADAGLRRAATEKKRAPGGKLRRRRARSCDTPRLRRTRAGRQTHAAKGAGLRRAATERNVRRAAGKAFDMKRPGRNMVQPAPLPRTASSAALCQRAIGSFGSSRRRRAPRAWRCARSAAEVMQRLSRRACTSLAAGRIVFALATCDSPPFCGATPAQAAKRRAATHREDEKTRAGLPSRGHGDALRPSKTRRHERGGCETSRRVHEPRVHQLPAAGRRAFNSLIGEAQFVIADPK